MDSIAIVIGMVGQGANRRTIEEARKAWEEFEINSLVAAGIPQEQAEKLYSVILNTVVSTGRQYAVVKDHILIAYRTAETLGIAFEAVKQIITAAWELMKPQAKLLADFMKEVEQYPEFVAPKKAAQPWKKDYKNIHYVKRGRRR